MAWYCGFGAAVPPPREKMGAVVGWGCTELHAGVGTIVVVLYYSVWLLLVGLFGPLCVFIFSVCGGSVRMIVVLMVILSLE